MYTTHVRDTGIVGDVQAPRSSVFSDRDRPQFFSEADCHDLITRLARFSSGGGHTHVTVLSIWTGNVRWARNQVSTSGEIQDNKITVVRSINGAQSYVELNDTTDAALVAAARRAERFARMRQESPNDELLVRRPLELATTPRLFSDATYQLDADHRAAAALSLAKTAQEAGMLSAGYIEVSAVGMGVMDTLGRFRYFPYTQARYSVTVRDPQGTGSGWAGVDHYDWAKIDGAKITAIALEKCLKARNPVRVEPGRYTVVLEPQAVGDLVGQLFTGWPPPIDRDSSEDPMGPFFKKMMGPLGFAKFGERIMDARITIDSDPMDPELGIPPFSTEQPRWHYDQFILPVYHAVTWIERGVLVNLAYDRDYAITKLGRPQGAPNSGAFRMSGGDTSIEEMIATTKRGLLVTRFDRVILGNYSSQLYRGFTRDGLWLIENGKITHPAQNLVFTESPLFVLNQIEQLGPPQRIYHPNKAPEWGIPQPAIVPPLKVSDFSFTALSDAV